MANLRAYEDGNRLVIVLENPDITIKELIMTLLSYELKQVEHLSAPEELQTPRLDFQSMEELKSSDKIEQRPKFIQKLSTDCTEVKGEENPVTNSLSHVNDSTPASDKKGFPEDLGSEIEDTNSAEDQTDKQQTIESLHNRIIPVLSKTDLEIMNIFELRNYIRERKHNLSEQMLITEAHTDDLEYILNVKSEKLLKKIALRLIG